MFSIGRVFSQDRIVGTWLTSDKKSHIKIYKQEGRYYGKLVWLKDSIDPSTNHLYRDIYNPDTSLRSRQVLGLVLLNHFEYNSKYDFYSKGSFYFPRDGRTYRGKMWLTDDKTLQMRGYVLIFHSTDTWRKVE